MDQETPPVPAPAAATPRRGAHWRRVAATVLLVGGALAAGLAWLSRSGAGAAWTLAQVPGLQAEGVHGSLLGGELAVDRLRLTIAGNVLTIEQARIQGLVAQFHPLRRGDEPMVSLQLTSLEARRAQWQSGPSTGPTPALTSLRLPLAVDAASVKVNELQVDALPVLREVQAQLAIGADGGARHRVQRLSWRSDRAVAEAHGEIGTDAPLTVQMAATAHSVDGATTPWQASLGLQGPLARLQAGAHLAGQGAANAPALDASATLAPFAPWPLAALQLSTHDLDLNALHAEAPHTRLRGQVRIDSQGLAADAEADATLDNDAPGRWDQGRLPVRHLQLVVRGQPQSVDRLTLKSLAVDLGGEAPAGRLQAAGGWQPADHGQALQLDLKLDGLRPALLDKRLPAMTLTGPLALQLKGLPAVGAAAAGASAASSPTAAASAAAGATQAGPVDWLATVRATLDGRLDPARSGAATPAVQLAVDADLSRQRVVLREAQARTGEAIARLVGQASFGPNGWPLQWQAQGELKDFDPTLWWPGLASTTPATPRRGATRLNALLDGNGRVTEPLQLSGWAGRLALQLRPSQWAGVPLQGELNAQRDDAGPGTLQAQAEASGNRVSLDAQEPRRGDNGAGQLDLKLDAPALASLAPLWPTLPAATGAAWWPRSGALQGRASLRWPASATERAAVDWQGELHASKLAHPGWLAERVDAQAQGRGFGEDALSFTANGSGLAAGQARVDKVQAELRGSLREHELSLQADSPARPPAWAEQLLGSHASSGSRVQLNLSGRWQPEAEAGAAAQGVLGAGRWQGRIARVLGQARDGSGQPWLAGRDLALQLAWDAAHRLTQASAEPGRVELPGTALRWAEARLQPATEAGAPPQWSLKAQLEAFELAPLLARAQPELGWQGDLVLGGDIAVQAGARLDADIVFERQKGDLSVADDVRDSSTPHRALGLSDLRLGLSAHDGTWHFTAGLAGRQLGEMAGVATAHTSAAARWPGDDAPLDGVFQLHVSQLGAWGAWVPPGWRLGGDLQSAATLGGRWGAPQFSGRLTGHRLEVRNALQGVQFNDGEVELSLQGDKARVEHFEWRGGEGKLSLTGEATLGRQPEAQLQMTADKLRVLGRVDRRLVASGQAELTLRANSAKLNGNLRVDEGLIDFSRGDAPTLDDDVRVVGADPAVRAEAGPAGAASTSPPANSAVDTAADAQRPFSSQMDVALDLGPALHVKGRGLDTYLQGSLRITNPGNRLAVRGDVRADRGTYAAYAQKLEIERGRLSFVGPVDDPRLDILAVRPNLDVTVGVAVTGSALNPRVKLYSDPEMADTDKLSWLMLGRAPDGLGRADTALLQRAAMALLAGEGETPTDAFLANIGLSDFGVRQTGEGTEQTTTVSLGKQLSRRWYIGYERSVNATAGTWQLIYRVAQRFTLRAQSGEDSALDAIWTWRWN